MSSRTVSAIRDTLICSESERVMHTGLYIQRRWTPHQGYSSARPPILLLIFSVSQAAFSYFTNWPPSDEVNIIQRHVISPKCVFIIRSNHFFFIFQLFFIYSAVKTSRLCVQLAGKQIVWLRAKKRILWKIKEMLLMHFWWLGSWHIVVVWENLWRPALILGFSTTCKMQVIP